MSIQVIFFVYLILLIPESPPSEMKPSHNKPFLWDQDAVWDSLEKRFVLAQEAGCESVGPSINKSFTRIKSLLDFINANRLQPDARIFSDLETEWFKLAPLIAACRHRLADFIKVSSRLRYVIKSQSHHWDMNAPNAREAVYRALYGGRGAVEEVMLQASPGEIPSRVMGHPEPSRTPSAAILGVTIHSGDILVSRGGSPTSALISRGNDFQGNFSHVALVHVDEKTHLASIVESHIESGVSVATLNDYLRDKKLRVMVLRLRADLPKMIQDPMLPHKAASAALESALARHIPYDFEMDYTDHSRLFCSEVASAPYQELGIRLWMGISSISSPGIARWLSHFGVKHFETQEPSDLEYDPQLRVVAEWRDPETLFKDHMDNAVVEAMIERAESGKDLEYSWYLLPLARIIKGYSSLLNLSGMTGPFPEGMSATAALRYKRFTDDHHMIRNRVEAMAAEFKNKNHYTSPYWQLLDYARQAIMELKY